MTGRAWAALLIGVLLAVAVLGVLYGVYSLAF
jgi:hypothetical protein